MSLIDIIRKICWNMISACQRTRQNLLPHGASRSAIKLHEELEFLRPCQPWNVIAILSHGPPQASKSRRLSSSRFSSAYRLSARPSHLILRPHTHQHTCWLTVHPPFKHLPVKQSARKFAHPSTHLQTHPLGYLLSNLLLYSHILSPVKLHLTVRLSTRPFVRPSTTRLSAADQSVLLRGSSRKNLWKMRCFKQSKIFRVWGHHVPNIIRLVQLETPKKDMKSGLASGFTFLIFFCCKNKNVSIAIKICSLVEVKKQNKKLKVYWSQSHITHHQIKNILFLVQHINGPTIYPKNNHKDLNPRKTIGPLRPVSKKHNSTF